MSTTENTTTAATQEQAVEAPNVELKVTVRPQAPDGRLYGFADVSFGGEKGYKVPGFQIKMNRDGVLYTDMAGGYDKAGNWNESIRPLSPAAYKHLNEAVLAEYALEIENTRAMLQATETLLAENQAQRQAPANEQSQPEKAAEPPATTQPVKMAERPNAAEQSKDVKAADKKPSLAGNLRAKQAQVRETTPAGKTPARSGNELGA